MVHVFLKLHVDFIIREYREFFHCCHLDQVIGLSLHKYKVLLIFLVAIPTFKLMIYCGDFSAHRSFNESLPDLDSSQWAMCWMNPWKLNNY